MKQNAVQNKRYYHGHFRSATTVPEVDTRVWHAVRNKNGAGQFYSSSTRLHAKNDSPAYATVLHYADQLVQTTCNTRQ